MNVDVVCVGDPFLDLIFLGLPALPVPGEERLAERLVIVPGGMANVAYALGRLELEAVICAPIGRDPAGRLLGELMADAGVAWQGRDTDATPVSVALPAHGERAFVTVSPPPRGRPREPGPDHGAGDRRGPPVGAGPAAPPAGLRGRRRSGGRGDGRPAAGVTRRPPRAHPQRARGPRADRAARCSRGGRPPRGPRDDGRRDPGCGRCARDRAGRAHRGCRRARWPTWAIRPARATCSRPPTCGPTSPAVRSRSGSASRRRYASLSLERATDRQKGIRLDAFLALAPTGGPASG